MTQQEQILAQLNDSLNVVNAQIGQADANQAVNVANYNKNKNALVRQQANLQSQIAALQPAPTS